MKYAVLAVLLAVMQASPPVPRKAANNSGDGGKNVKQDSSRQQAPPSTPVVSTPHVDQNSRETPSDANAQETIVVSESAPVPKAAKDWWDKAYVIFTGLLVIIGGLGVGFAVRTLRAIEWQAEETKTAAQAAKTGSEAAQKSAEALIAIERPWVLISHLMCSYGIFDPGDGKPRTMGYCNWRFRAYGSTPARIIEIGGAFRTVESIENLPAEPVYGKSPNFTDYTVIAPGLESNDVRIPYESMADNPFSAHRDKPLVLMGFVKYSDPFGTTHETRFCYLYNWFRAQFEKQIGPGAYNRNT
jgi:hypothetical protein